MKLLLVEDEADLREVLACYLEGKLQAEILEASSGNEAIALLEAHSDIDCVVSDYRMNNGTGGDVYLYLQQKLSGIPYILCSCDRPEDHVEFTGAKLAGYFQKPFQAKDLVTKVQQVVEARAQASVPSAEEYCRIRTSILLKFTLLRADLYLKLSEQKHVRVFVSGESLSTEDVSRYIAKKVEYLYVKKEDAGSFLDDLARGVLALAMQREAEAQDRAKREGGGGVTGANDLEFVLTTAKAALEVVHQIGMKLGFPPGAQELTKASAKIVLKAIEKCPELGDIFRKQMSNGDSYICSHSVMMAYTSCGMAALMGWDSELTRHKLILAAFLHDLSVENDEIARIQTMDDFIGKTSKFTEKEVQEYIRHPEASAQLVAMMQEVPPEVDGIVRQHHERADGSGFPHRHDHARISPLSSLFILAHEVVSWAILDEGGMDPMPLLERLKRAYSVGNFKKIVAVMAKAAQKASASSSS